MKKFWIVLIALGLVAAFSMSASAADVKFSGSYYIEGWYDDNHSLLAKDDPKVGSTGGNMALYHQRLRVNTEFKVAEGLSLTTRFDALERNWGDRRERNYTTPTSTSTSNYTGTVEDVSRNVAGASAISAQEQANIEFERVFITANLPFGVLIAGYAEDIKWGTDFMDTVTTRPQIKLIVPIGNLTLVGAIKKDLEGTMYNGYGAINNSDKDIYDLAGVYKWKSGEAGLLFEYIVNNAGKSTGYGSYSQRLYGLFPYFKQTFGPVFLEGEAYYGAGQAADFDNAGGTIQKSLETWGGYLHAKVDLKPVYFGARFIYMLGDDPTTTNKVEGTMAAQLAAGQAFTPCLMLWNDSYYTAIGSGLGGRAPTSTGLSGTQLAVNGGNTAAMQFIDNVIFYQAYVGVKPVDKLDVFGSVTYAMAQNKPNDAAGLRYISDIYGTEIDVTATYKIYDNLSYTVGFGYLFTGDYFKGSDPNAKLTNDYILMHKLSLTF
jgi:hypothetical protein